jgi:hypothetical protein
MQSPGKAAWVDGEWVPVIGRPVHFTLRSQMRSTGGARMRATTCQYTGVTQRGKRYCSQLWSSDRYRTGAWRDCADHLGNNWRQQGLMKSAALVTSSGGIASGAMRVPRMRCFAAVPCLFSRWWLRVRALGLRRSTLHPEQVGACLVMEIGWRVKLILVELSANRSAITESAHRQNRLRSKRGPYTMGSLVFVRTSV